ncbi:MAG: 3'-5' exonuclease, partial [Acholeplasmataceae bacterium]
GFCYKVLIKHMPLNLVDENFLINEGYTKDELRMIDIQKRNQYASKQLKKYNKLLKKQRLVDFTDLERLLLEKLKNKTFESHLKNQYKYIFIDEFQDTSSYQFSLVKHLKSDDGMIFAVGDPDQSIYGFRGANKNIIQQFLKHFKATLYTLDLNYRSSKEIVAISNRLIVHNTNRYPKSLHSCIKEKGQIHIRYFKDATNKVEYILKEIRHLLTLGIKYEDIAILYRNHYVSNTLKHALKDSYIQNINLLTIHQSKGLEFKAVMIIGLNEGILPMEDIEEDRRLMYVAMTRAKRHLYLLIDKSQKVSRFINECI